MRINRTLAPVAFALAGLVGLGLTASSASAEKLDMPPQALSEVSTHIVVGEVKAIFSRKASDGDWRYTRYVAEVNVKKVEKGTGIDVGGPVYVRYWTRTWASTRPAPSSTAGHRDLPIEGQTLRIYLAKNAYDGFTHDNKDGGFNVIGANGFEVPSPPAPSGPPLEGWIPAKGNLKIGVRLYEGAGEKKTPYGVVIRFVGQDRRVIVRYTGGDMDAVEESLELSAPIWSRLYIRRDDAALK